MPHILQNGTLEIHIELPHEGYNHTRFDWTGKIKKVSFKGIGITGNELERGIEGKNCGEGFYNEFGIDKPIGFDEIPIGDWFHKIGVGLLKKDDTEYQFHKLYKVQSADFKVKIAESGIQISCLSENYKGIAYRLIKEITLLEEGFQVHYTLENTGEKAIITNEYNHNFLCIGNEAVNDNYVLKLPFAPTSSKFGEFVNPDEILNIQNNQIVFKHTPNHQFFISNLSGGNEVMAKWTLINRTYGMAVCEHADFTTKSINLWGWSHVISPELFIELNIPAGQSKSWSRQYRIFEIKD